MFAVSEYIYAPRNFAHETGIFWLGFRNVIVGQGGGPGPDLARGPEVARHHVHNFYEPRMYSPSDIVNYTPFTSLRWPGGIYPYRQPAHLNRLQSYFYTFAGIYFVQETHNVAL